MKFERGELVYIAKCFTMPPEPMDNRLYIVLEDGKGIGYHDKVKVICPLTRRIYWPHFERLMKVEAKKQ